MPKLNSWAEGAVHYAAIDQFQAWSKADAAGARRALRTVLASKGRADLAAHILEA